MLISSAALMEGVVEVRSGCVFISAYKDRWLLLWPEGFSARLADGQLQLRDEGGEVVGREGEPVRVGGGEGRPRKVGGEGAAERWPFELTGWDIPERCGDLYLDRIAMTQLERSASRPDGAEDLGSVTKRRSM